MKHLSPEASYVITTIGLLAIAFVAGLACGTKWGRFREWLDWQIGDEEGPHAQ